MSSSDALTRKKGLTSSKIYIKGSAGIMPCPEPWWQKLSGMDSTGQVP